MRMRPFILLFAVIFSMPFIFAQDASYSLDLNGPSSLSGDGSQTGTFTIRVTDQNGNFAPEGTPIHFGTSSASLEIVSFQGSISTGFASITVVCRAPGTFILRATADLGSQQPYRIAVISCQEPVLIPPPDSTAPINPLQSLLLSISPTGPLQLGQEGVVILDAQTSSSLFDLEGVVLNWYYCILEQDGQNCSPGFASQATMAEADGWTFQLDGTRARAFLFTTVPINVPNPPVTVRLAAEIGGFFSNNIDVRIIPSSLTNPPQQIGAPTFIRGFDRFGLAQGHQGTVSTRGSLLSRVSDPDTPISNLVFSVVSQTNPSVIDCSFLLNGVGDFSCNVASNAPFNAETIVTVRVSDGIFSDTTTIPVFVQDINEGIPTTPPSGLGSQQQPDSGQGGGVLQPGPGAIQPPFAPSQPSPPVFSVIPTVTFGRNSGFHDNAVDLRAFVSDADTPVDSLIFSIVGQTNPSVVSCNLDSNRFVDCSVENRMVGTSQVTVSVSDGSSTATSTFTIRVRSVENHEHQFGIESVFLSDYIARSGDVVTVYTKVRNTGGFDESGVQLRASLIDFSLADFAVTSIFLGENEVEWVPLSFRLPPALWPGEYVVRVIANNRHTDSQAYATFTVE
ncbi:hypothetical protein J4430_03270 [Candidatus Woesearchaeota archaeon]|nr:hypothetical protein [Candidatus Woesearchaeota archaeon]